MREVKRYLIQKTPIGTMMKPNAEGNWVEAQDLDRVTAELKAALGREAALRDDLDMTRSLANNQQQLVSNLQQLLTAADERADVLEGLLRGALRHVPNYGKSDWKGSLRHQINEALKPAEGGRDEPNCLLCLDKKTVPSNLAEGYVMDCPDCCGEEG